MPYAESLSYGRDAHHWALLEHPILQLLLKKKGVPNAMIRGILFLANKTRTASFPLKQGFAGRCWAIGPG